jgi:hypothetical protein
VAKQRRTARAKKALSAGRFSIRTYVVVEFDTCIGVYGIEWSNAGITRVLMLGRRRLTGSRLEEAAEIPDEVRNAI